ncbi:hypothetical protein AVEN_93428-1 [Araneus ventricosus]|uniref:Uncharacterized protein n=1 Tax=Araneus ventricosus TaxID=182803 RepID=A0A4Y2AQ49_ARAVE|nr:hypothetical protein AVEN_93428-1 [Araneus ventricosus]
MCTFCIDGKNSHPRNIWKSLVFLVTLTSPFEATRGRFWNGPRNFEPRSDDEDDIRAGTPFPNFRTTPTGGHLTPYIRFNEQQAPNMTDLQWNLVSSLEPSGSEAATLPLGHRDPYTWKRIGSTPVLMFVVKTFVCPI